MKALISTDALLAYPNPDKPYNAETDASNYQLGSIIKQDNCPIAYFSSKLNSAQKNYTTIEKELLSIIETFKEFCSILLGPPIWVHSDHKNLTHTMTTYTTQCILHCQLQLEEFKPSFLYKTGPSNIVADALSRVPTDTHCRTVGRHLLAHTPSHVSQLLVNDQNLVQEPLADTHTHILPTTALPPNSLLTSTPNLAECLLEHPPFDEDGNLPFQFATMWEYQQCDHTIANLATTHE